MGASAGGKFVVSATPVSHLTTVQKSNLLRQKYSIGPAIVKGCGDTVCAAQNAVCDGAVGKCVCLDGSAMSNGKCTVRLLLPPSQQKSIPLKIALGFKSRDAERWDAHRRAIRKSMARTLLLNFNAYSPVNCPFLSLGEHDVTINKVDQTHTNSAVVHASVAFWGPAGNAVATRCSRSMQQSIVSVIANGRLAQSVQQFANLGSVPHLAMGDAVEGTTVSAITTPGGCKQWCAGNKQAWEKKCTWLGLCDGCSDCRGIVSTTKTAVTASPSTKSNAAGKCKLL
jgi:hypothetical protein